MSHLLAFIGIALVVICTPGPDTALIVRNTLFGGRANGVRTAGGVVTGLAVWTVAASAGVAAVLAASHLLFMTLRIGGAAYLVWLGIQTLRGRHAGTTEHARHGGGYRQGLLSNLGNPKVAIFFTSLLPQFGSDFGGMLAFGLLFCTMGATWLTGYALVTARARTALLRPRVRRALDTLTGITLVAFGARLATEQR
jgi:threonine/homoserine/homoserine lactone efflux protein